MWTLMPQQQQRGVQFEDRRRKDAPAEAVRDRAAQDHEQAGEWAEVPDAGYPASRIEDREGDNTPTAPGPDVAWDEAVRHERRHRKES